MSPRPLLSAVNRFLALPLTAGSRALMLAAVLLMIPAYVFPLWKLTMFAPQYPDGLRMDIYSHKLDGGNGGQDVREINVLNHYIGMKDIQAADFDEFKWIPFVLGAITLLVLRGIVHGTMAALVDDVFLFLYFGLFSIWSFGFKLWSYGHHLDPGAPVRVAPFMPPLFGYRKLANFEVYSYPSPGSYALVAVFVVLVGAVFLTWRAERAQLSRPLPAATVAA